MPSKARIPPVNRSEQDYELEALFGKNGALSRSSDGELSASYETGDDGISVFTVKDSSGNKLTLEGEAVTGVNNVGSVWRVGDFSTNAYVPIINPKLTGHLDPASNKVSFDIKTSTERLAEKINSAFDSFYKKKKGDDTSVLGMFRRELSRTIFAENDPDKIEAILNAGHSQSYELQRNLMSTTIVGYTVIDPTSKYGFSKASPLQEGTIDKAIGEMVGRNVPLNTSDPFAIEKNAFYQENGKTVQTSRPLSGIDVHAVNTRTGYLDMAPKVGPYSSSEIIYHRDDKGRVLKNQNGPIIERVEVQTAFAKGGAGYVKSKTVPGAGIVPSEMTPVMEEVWDSEKNAFTKRKVMREVQPLERYDNQPAPAVMRLNLRTSGEAEQENTSRVGEVKNLLIAPWTVPGAAGVFGDSRGRNVKQYANIKDVSIDTPAFSMLQAQSNQVQFDINPARLIGDVGARPRSSKRLGTVSIGDRQTDLKLKLAQAKTNISGMTLQVPRFVSDDLKSWSASGGAGYREFNDTDRTVLQNILPKGFGVSVSNVAEAPGFFAQLSTQSAANDSGSGIKQGFDLMPTMKMTRSQGRGRDRVEIPVDMISGEVKQPTILFMEAGFGARTTAQQKGILADYLHTQHVRSKSKGKHQLRTIADDDVNAWFADMSIGFQPGNSPDTPQHGYKMHWSDITQFLNEKLGTSMTELDAGASVFQSVFAEEDKLDAGGSAVPINPSGKKNLENLKKYEIGYTDAPIPLRGIHQDRLNLMREAYRRSAQDMGWTDEQIQAGFDKTFQVNQVPGTPVYNGKMVLNDENGKPMPFLSMNAALVKKAESIGGGGIGPEAGSMIYEHDPELSRRMGYDPAEMGIQSPNNRSLLQLRKWLAVEQSIASGDINTSNLKLDRTSTFNVEQDTPGIIDLLDVATNYDPKETGAYPALMDRVSEIVGGRDKEIYFPALNAFLPPVNAAENTLNYEQDGVQNSRGGIAWISSLKSMLEETLNAEPGTVNEETGREAVSKLEQHVFEMFDKGGDANKDMFKREIPFSASMRFGSMSILGNNQAWINKETRRRVMLDSGLSREGIAEFEKSLSQSYADFKSGQSSVMGVPMVSFRWPPQAGGNAISDMNLLPDEYIADTLKKVGAATGERVNINETLRSGRYNDIFFVNSQFAAEKFGDFDYDPGWFAWLVQNKETDEGKTEFYKKVEDTWAGYRSHDPAKVQEIEENVLGLNKEDPRKLSPLVDKVSADLGAMKDIIAGKDPMKARNALGVTKSDLSQFAQDTIAVHQNATKGMGTTYNLRRAMEFALETNGFGLKDVSNAKAMAQAHYQPYLDKMYNIGAQIEGTELATMASRATIKQNENGSPYLQLTTSSEEAGHNKVKKVYFDERGQGILSAYSWMLQVAEKGIVADTNKGKTKYEVTQDKLLAALASPSKELEPRIMAAMQDERYGKTRSARALGAVSEWINEAGSDSERVTRRKSVARSALFKLPFFNALGKHAYDENNNLLPGNFGESPVQAAMLRQLEDTGYGRDLAEELQAGAVNLSMLTGGKRGFAPAHILNKALGITREIISAKFGSNIGDVPAGIQNTIAKLEALGGMNVADSADPTWKEATSKVELARRAIRNISESAVDLDVETTGITYGANGRMESTGKIWQIGINGESKVVHPGLTKGEYTRQYETALKASGPESWVKHLPKPEDFDAVFGSAPNFTELWKSGGLRESILNAESWTSYTSFDRTAILEELRTAKGGAADKAEADYWTGEIDSFRKSNYANLYSDPSGNVLHLGEIFRDEIKRYNEAPEHVGENSKPLTNKLQDIATALAWEGNKDFTKDVFPDQESRERFTDLVGRQEMAHDAGYDSGMLGALRVGAINRVSAHDDAERNKTNARSDARSRGHVFKKVINQRAQGQPVPQNSPAGNPPPTSGGKKPMREIRASMMDHDPETEAGRTSLMIAFAGEMLGKNSIPSKESVGGQKVHEEAQKLLNAQDPASNWEAEVGGSVMLGDVKVTGTVDDISRSAGKIIDYKSDSSTQHPFQMKVYEMIHGAQTFIARYSRSARNNKEYGKAAQGAVDKVLSGNGLERGTTKTDAEATQRAQKIADFKETYQTEISELAGKIKNGDIDIPTEENDLLPFRDVIARIAPHISGVTQFAPSQEPPNNTGTGSAQQQNTPSPKASQQNQGGGQYWGGRTRVNPQRVNQMREQLIRLSKSLQESKPFITASLNAAPATPGAPGMKFFQGAIQAAFSFDVVNGAGRNAASAAIDSLEQFRKISKADDTIVSEAFATLSDDVQTVISEHPYNNVVSNPDVNVLMDSVVGGLKGRLTRTAKGAIDRSKDIRIYQDFFARSDVGKTRDALSQYLAADSAHTARGFFEDVIANRNTSPHAGVLFQMDRNASSLFSAVEHLRSKNQAVDPLLAAYEDSLDANTKKLFRSPDKLSGWTKQYDDSFYDAAQKKAMFEPGTLGWKLQMAQEDILQAEAKLSTAQLNRDDALNSGASQAARNKHNFVVSQAVQGVQKAQRAYRDLELSDRQRGYSSYSDYTDALVSSPFKQAVDAFQSTSGTSEEKIKAALSTSPEARGAMVHARNLYTGVPKELKPETGENVKEFFMAMDAVKRNDQTGIFDMSGKSQTLLDADFAKNFSVKMKKYLEDLGSMTDELTRKTGGLNEVRGKEARILDLQVRSLQSKIDIQQRGLEVEAIKSKKSEMDQLPENSLERLTYEKTLAEAVQKHSNAVARGEKYEKYYSQSDPDGAKAAATEDVEKSIEQDDKNLGSFFRHAFGGFGLMYLRSVIGIASGPLVNGYQQRMRSQQEIGGTVFGILGGSREVNSDEELARAQGLYLGGQGWETFQRGMAATIRSVPGTVSALGNMATGVSLYGATTWMMSQAPNKRMISLQSKADWENLDDKQQQAKANNAIAAWSGAVALIGMLSTNSINMAGAMNNPTVTARTIAARAASGGPSDGFDPLGALLSSGSGALAGGMAGSITGSPIGIGVGAVSGAVVNAVTSQKDWWAYTTNPVIREQADRGASGLSFFGGGSGISSSMQMAEYTPNRTNEYVGQIAYSLSANPSYSDISQKSLASVVANSLKYGYNLDEKSIINLSRQMDRGIDLIGISKSLSASTGAGGLVFSEPSGQTETRETFKAVKPGDIEGQVNLEAIYGGMRYNPFGIRFGMSNGKQFSSEDEFQKYLKDDGIQAAGKSLHLGGQGDNLSSVRFTVGDKGSYDVWGTTGLGTVQNLGVTNDPLTTANSIKQYYSNGTQTTSISVGESMVNAIMNEVNLAQDKSGKGALTEEIAYSGLQKLAELKILNRDNYKDFEKDSSAWFEKTQRIVSMSGTLEEQALTADVQLWQAQKAIGQKTTADAPDIFDDKYNPGMMTEADLTEYLARTNAQTEVVNRKKNLQTLAYSANELYGVGNPDTFAKQVAGLNIAELGAMEGVMSFSGSAFGNMLGRYGTGQTLMSEQLATAGIQNNSIDMRWMYSGGYTNLTGPDGQQQRVATGLGWGQGGNDFGWGGFGQQTVLNNFMGKGWESNPILAQAAKGIALGENAITLPNGSKIDTLKGFEAINWQVRQENYAEQQFSIGQQLKSADLSFAFTTGQGLSKYGDLPAGGSWGIEQRQMQLGWKQQEFGFQMQQKQMDLSSAHFAENMGLNRQQMTMQRSWAQEDWGINAQVRALQWGWKQQDFAEESRFMTGRQRRLAERQMKRDTQMHDIEGDQIERQINRQKESWKLEDERFVVQKKQFEESKKLQEEQLQANRKFFEESKKLQLESRKLQHAQFLEQHKLQMAGIAYTQKHTALMKDLQDKLQLAQVAAAQYQVQIGNVGSVGIAGMLTWAEQLTPAIKELLQPFQDLIDKNKGKTGTSAPAPTGGSQPLPGATPFAPTTSYIPFKQNKPAAAAQTVVLTLDGEIVQRWVVNQIAEAI